MSALDFVLGFGRIVASSIEPKTGGILGQVLGIIGSLDPDEKDDELGETGEKQDLYNGLGILGNPLPPETIRGTKFACDVVYAKRGDGMVPIAYKDLRLSKSFPAGLKKGSVAFAGYGGGFYSLDLTSGNSGSQKANIHVIYCPYSFNGSGVAGKAHSIILDPTSGNESVTITHGEGYQLALTANDGLLALLSASTFMRAKPGEFLLQAPKIMLKGNVYLGAQAETGIPLVAGAASQPTFSIFFSAV
jgi:hypothetical protein